MPDAQIFKATYSGVPVYEMMCKGVAVMRRRADGWLNATQILKVAGFDKPQRTRVLERDVQKGMHEKVQGGYGKYQGTWIPPERGLALAKQYNCDHILKPIIDFQPEAKSPPLAPKHAVGPIPGRPAAGRRLAASADSHPSARNGRKTVREEIIDEISVIGSEDETESRSTDTRSSTSPTPSPIQETPDHSMYDSADEDRATGVAASPRRRGRRRHTNLNEGNPASDAENGANGATTDYCDEILEYFISDSNQVPQFLISPPADFDPNMIIDDDGHTALHWAAAMGRIRVVKLLLTAGADIFKVNKSGQTALMRSVMFANNYDVRKFPELYELLHRSTLNIDNYNRTVFHHIVDIAMSKGKTHAARYYMETILQRLADFPKELADIINFQDEDGETALTMAARCRSKRLVKLLIDHGADPKITNRDCKSTEDYILEDERFRSSPVLPSRSTNMSFRHLQAAYPPYTLSHNYSQNQISDKPPLHHSVTAQIASTRCVNDMAIMLESLAQSFDQELKEKERDMAQALSLLGSIQSEILESQRSVSQLKQQSQGYEGTEEALATTINELKSKMARRYKIGLEKWLAVEEARERVVRASPMGKKLPQIAEDSTSYDDHLSPDKGKDKMEVDEEISDLEALYAELPTDEERLRSASQALRAELQQLGEDRRSKINALVDLQTESGTSKKMNQYRRLISAGCGGLPLEEVDQVIGILLETLEAEEPTSAIAWTSQQNTSAVTVVS